MLDLSSKSWNDLCTAYGSALDVPDLLRQLQTAPPQEDYQSEPWFSLWSALCHQGDVYTATYAAIPHIVAISKTGGHKVQLDCLSFVGYAEACRHHKRAPALPPNLKADYEAALRDSPELFVGALKQEWGEEETKVLLGGLASVRGHPRLGEAIIELDSSFQCLECGCDLSGGRF
jgi:hypothetical protein